ncbi:MAG TPA: endonuclease, partial [Flavobacterium sp.]|nr:endonuclease [Flavobacterium sp.]
PLKKMGYRPVFINQKTTLRNTCMDDDCLASPFDNIFYQVNKIKIKEKGVKMFHRDFASLKAAQKISDHLPIWIMFDLL